MSIIDDMDQITKDQKVRAFDIYALGPFLIWASLQKKALGPWSRKTLFVAGAMTLVYNWKRYRTMNADLKKAISDV